MQFKDFYYTAGLILKLIELYQLFYFFNFFQKALAINYNIVYNNICKRDTETVQQNDTETNYITKDKK